MDADSKFTKLADRECETLSAEVKRWFKSLAVSQFNVPGATVTDVHCCVFAYVQKEEKAHDARLASANGKIKQAGQTYEKMVKKNPANAAEEHARYINILGTVGPSISQEKLSVPALCIISFMFHRNFIVSTRYRYISNTQPYF